MLYWFKKFDWKIHTKFFHYVCKLNEKYLNLKQKLRVFYMCVMQFPFWPQNILHKGRPAPTGPHWYFHSYPHWNQVSLHTDRSIVESLPRISSFFSNLFWKMKKRWFTVIQRISSIASIQSHYKRVTKNFKTKSFSLIFLVLPLKTTYFEALAIRDWK